MRNVKGFRVVWHHHGCLHRVARVMWSKRDASLYVVPYPTDSTGLVGTVRLDDESTTFDASKIGYPGRNPKLSIHESGGVHAQVDDGHRTHQLRGNRLDADSGGHIASVVCFDPVGLPTVGEPRGGRNPDVVLVSDHDDGLGLAAAIYATTREGHLARWETQFTIKMARPTLAMPLLIGIRFRGVAPADGGVAVLAGWGPGPPERRVNELVFAVTEALPTRG